MAKTVKTWGYHVLIAIDQLFKRRQYPAEFRAIK